MNRDNHNHHQPEASPAQVAGCEGAEQLVTYFYGEASRAEERGFEQHLAGCAACREELTAFDSVRRAVGAWRTEALGQVRTPSFQFHIIPASIDAAPPEQSARPAYRSHQMPKRSALAALRAFFDLSPLWLRVGGATTAAAACVLAALAVFGAEVRWDDRGLVARTGAPVVRERIVTPAAVVETTAVVPTEKQFTASQVEAIVAERAKQQRAELLAELKEQTSAQQASKVTPNRAVNARARVESIEVARRNQTRRRSNNVPPAVERPREPLVVAADREPQLYDLLGEVD